MSGFVAFPKIGRWSRDVVITEKLDGTNAQVLIGSPLLEGMPGWLPPLYYDVEQDLAIWAGSRNRYISLDADNYGFAAWVERNAEELIKLGEGRHFGEWWGKGIQRNYGLNERRFSLFNASRWTEDNTPEIVDVVPMLYQGPLLPNTVEDTMRFLKDYGSVACSGFMRPEGIVIYHTANGAIFKKTFEHDEKGKEAA